MTINIKKVPAGRLIYDPVRPFDFSRHGEGMVTEFIEATPSFFNAFNEIVPLDEQKPLLETCFSFGKVQYMQEKAKLMESRPIIGEILYQEGLEAQKKSKNPSKSLF